jgi:hypothetical protein
MRCFVDRHVANLIIQSYRCDIPLIDAKEGYFTPVQQRHRHVDNQMCRQTLPTVFIGGKYLKKTLNYLKIHLGHPYRNVYRTMITASDFSVSRPDAATETISLSRRSM